MSKCLGVGGALADCCTPGGTANGRKLLAWRGSYWAMGEEWRVVSAIPVAVGNAGGKVNATNGIAGEGRSGEYRRVCVSRREGG
jgi:hypothetical protein